MRQNDLEEVRLTKFSVHYKSFENKLDQNLFFGLIRDKEDAAPKFTTLWDNTEWVRSKSTVLHLSTLNSDQMVFIIIWLLWHLFGMRKKALMHEGETAEAFFMLTNRINTTSSYYCKAICLSWSISSTIWQALVHQ